MPTQIVDESFRLKMLNRRMLLGTCSWRGECTANGSAPILACWAKKGRGVLTETCTLQNCLPMNPIWSLSNDPSRPHERR